MKDYLKKKSFFYSILSYKRDKIKKKKIYTFFNKYKLKI